jgi:hypothetical protein
MPRPNKLYLFELRVQHQGQWETDATTLVYLWPSAHKNLGYRRRLLTKCGYRTAIRRLTAAQTLLRCPELHG